LDVDLFSYVRVVLRWSWVTIIAVAATVAVILYTNADVPLVYQATAKFIVSAPEPGEVALYTTVRAGTPKDDIAAVQADFSGIMRGALAARMTIDALGLKMTPQELLDKIINEIPVFSDFVYVHVSDANPKDAATIANVHAANTLKIYGETRAKSTTVRIQFITEQLQSATKNLNDARTALLRFQTKNGTADLTRDIQGYQDTMRTLKTERDRNMVEIERASGAASYYTTMAQKATAENDNAAAASYRGSAAANQASIEGLRAAVTRQNELIAQKENELLSLVGLTTEYNRIVGEVQRAESNYNFLQGKLSEAQTKEADARSAGFIQLFEPATPPTRAQKVQTRNMLIPGVAASLAGGIILSFLLEIVFGRSRRRRSAGQ
jgi:uncharacterized protein involved in exopolysaccharide biosynthesis